MKTLNFLSDFWQRAKIAVDDICTELPKVQSENILKPLGTSGKMWTIQYKDLGNNWGKQEYELEDTAFWNKWRDVNGEYKTSTELLEIFLKL